MSNHPARRRGPTRWLLITPLVGLATIISGVVVLEAMMPEVDTEGREVEHLPELGIEDEDQLCTRRADDPSGQDIRELLPPEGRVSSVQVANCPSAFDGLRVTYVGEVIGEVLQRRGGAWVQVNDDQYALRDGPLVGHRKREGFNSGLAVWLPDGLHERIEAPGRPARRGDIILVRGVLLRADPDDGGGTTVRADHMEVLEPPMDVEVPLHTVQAGVAGVLAMVAVGMLAWSRRVRQR
jgi:hypothetical protein